MLCWKTTLLIMLGVDCMEGGLTSAPMIKRKDLFLIVSGQ